MKTTAKLQFHFDNIFTKNQDRALTTAEHISKTATTEVFSKQRILVRCETDLPDADLQSWCSTSADLTVARSNNSTLQARVRCVVASDSSLDTSAKQPTNQLLFSTAVNLHSTVTVSE